jgi:hypothetical protein
MSLQILSGLSKPGYWLDVDGNSFLDPVVIVIDRRKGGVDELMGHHPIIVEILLRTALADMDAGEAGKASNASPRGAAAYAGFAGNELHQDTIARNRKTSVIRGDGERGISDPLDDLFLRKVSRARPKVDLN